MLSELATASPWLAQNSWVSESVVLHDTQHITGHFSYQCKAEKGIYFTFLSFFPLYNAGCMTTMWRLDADEALCTTAIQHRSVITRPEYFRLRQRPEKETATALQAHRPTYSRVCQLRLDLHVIRNNLRQSDHWPALQSSPSCGYSQCRNKI